MSDAQSCGKCGADRFGWLKCPRQICYGGSVFGQLPHTHAPKTYTEAEVQAHVAAEVRKALEGAAPWAKLGVAVMEDWPDGIGDIDGFQMQDMAEASGVLVAVPGGFNPDEHDGNGESEPGDPWFFMIKHPALIPAALTAIALTVGNMILTTALTLPDLITQAATLKGM
jgi:hypothetical protein